MTETNRDGPEVSALIVGFHSERTIGKTLASLARASSAAMEVLVISNSGPALEEFVRAACPDAEIVPGEGNIGFAAGNNRLATAARGQWLLLLNPDTELSDGTVDRLLDAAAAHPEISAFGAAEFNDRAGELGVPALPTIAEQLRTLSGTRRKGRVTTGARLAERSMLSGSMVLIRRETWMRFGGMDESFFLYGEDADLFRRMADAGLRFATVPAARYFHDRASGDALSPVRMRLMFTGIAHYFRTHERGSRMWLALALQWAIAASRFFPALILAPFWPRMDRIRRGYAEVTLAPRSWIAGYPRESAGR